MLELMEALRRTSFAKKIGRRLADVPADTAHSLHGLLSMHTSEDGRRETKKSAPLDGVRTFPCSFRFTGSGAK